MATGLPARMRAATRQATRAVTCAARRGLTLIELMVVMGLIAMLISIGTLALSSIQGADVSASASVLAGAMRYVSTLAIHHNQTYRLVIDMDNALFYTEAANSDDPCARYLPEGDAADPLSQDEEAAAAAAEGERRVSLAEDGDATTASERSAAAFSRDDSELLSEHFQPDTNVVRLVTEHHSEPQQGGKAAIYFYPTGRAERAMVWLGVGEDEDGETVWTPELTLELHALARVTRYSSVIDEGEFMRDIARTSE